MKHKKYFDKRKHSGGLLGMILLRILIVLAALIFLLYFYLYLTR